ncbi:hypothetical protein [Bacillus sp. AFS041924]|uniref:hypothetical protein n=1 Tax=Bacillus sp. AFS041924 TaxID=2033503 RepID=UPI000BFC220E|nr:hypothetical protein [Bacillus sp. AFS041924]PGS51206.1 hypothetical protein COC46_11725 [Bacillus sp. AFS041924]
MTENFFANYEQFVVPPLYQIKREEQTFNPKDYAMYYILTVSLYDSLISDWNDAAKYNINVRKSIDHVLNDFNERKVGKYHLQLLEFENDKSYFVIALSIKNKIEKDKINEIISSYIEQLISNSFYIGQSWYWLIGQKGKRERKLFNISIKEYTH